MATTTVTLVGNVRDMIDGEFDTRRTKVYLRHNTTYVADPDSGHVRLGSATVTVENDGSFELPDVIASVSTVENLQATIYVDYADPSTRNRTQQSFGPYDLSAESGTVELTTLEEVQRLDPTFVSETMTAMQALLDAQEEIAGLTGEDGAVAYLIGDTGSETSAALTTAIEDVLAGDTTVADAAAAAAETAVDAELMNAGVLYASDASGLDTTRVLDPQVKTSGGVGSSGTFTLSRITTGLPTGFSYGVESTRTGTLSAVIATPYFGSTSNSDPLRITVTPAEVVTLAAYVWTNQSSARARMDVLFYNSSGVQVGSTLTGTYSSIAASTWEQRVQSGVTVPATAAYMIGLVSVSTNSGNTVTGAKARLTGGIVVSGTVASPTYHDGDSLDWAWTGTPHASTSKKILLATGDFETPAGTTAAVAAHVAASNPHPAYFRKTVAPTIATNRAVDPQLVVAGASASAPSYPITRITTGLPTGFSYGLETVRAGTLNGTIAQVVLAPAALAQANALRIPVTPAETISVSAYMWTDDTNARARLDLIYYDSSGVIVGSTVAGTYSNIAASTWEVRSQIAVTVPALAAYVAPQATIAKRSGGGNATTGIKARTTGVVVSTGTILAYGDGSFEGWDWSGTEHASTSLRKFPTAAQALAQAGALTLVKSGASVSISRLFDTSKTLTQNLSLTGSNHGGFNFLSTTLDGTSIHVISDDICPIRMQLGTVGANHGYTNVASFTNPDSKTTADLGSLWQDTAGRQYRLLDISGGLLIMGGDYTSPGGVTTSADVNPITNLTHVSGATHTGAINYTTKAAAELFPSVQRIYTTLWADGKQVTADGTITAREVVVRESYAILDYASIYDLAGSNIGVSFSTLTVNTAVRVSNTYRWTPAGCRVTTNLTELRPTTLGQCGAIQSAALGDGSTTYPKRYLPGVGTVSGFDWTAGVDLTSYSTDVVVATANLSTSTRPPAFSLDVLPNSGTPTIGFALGYLPYGARSDDASKNSTRLTKAGTKLWDLRGTKKNYPTFTMSETAGWEHITVESFRAYLDPTQAAAVIALKGDALSAWESLNTQANLGAA